MDERQRRLLLGSEATELGRGGIKLVAGATGTDSDTVSRGVHELAGEAPLLGRVRTPGGGRKKLGETDPEVLKELRVLVDPTTRGDPMSLLVWTTKSTQNIADALTQQGHPVSDRTVARRLRDLGFSLQGNAKVTEGHQHPNRDAQFRYPAARVSAHAGDGQPVVSVDAEKKELVGDFKNLGREYQPAGQPAMVVT